jgi:putative redox protein
MVRIDLEYEGELHTRARHAPSGAALETDAPVDNHGKGEAFSPTDLLATSLGACMITVMGIAANKDGIALDGTKLRVEKTMTPTLPRKVARLDVELVVPAARATAIPPATRARLEQIGETCPVRLSLSPEIQVETSYVWEGADV